LTAGYALGSIRFRASEHCCGEIVKQRIRAKTQGNDDERIRIYTMEREVGSQRPRDWHYSSEVIKRGGNEMNLREYFEEKTGHGIIATADAKGKVGIAVYAKPYVIDDGLIAFIMAAHQSYANVRSNPSAAYLFVETGGQYAGKRLYLTKTREAAGSDIGDPELAKRFEKAAREYREYKDEKLSLVYFKVDRVLPLVGDKE
jgi:hypothetical protein